MFLSRHTVYTLIQTSINSVIAGVDPKEFDTFDENLKDTLLEIVDQTTAPPTVGPTETTASPSTGPTWITHPIISSNADLLKTCTSFVAFLFFLIQ